MTTLAAQPAKLKPSIVSLAGAIQDRARLTGDFRQFIRAAWPIVEPGSPFVPGWHIDAIADHLAAVGSGQIKRLVINIPFRCAKSTLCGVLWPAWSWASKPGTRWLTGSYADKLATRDALRTRRLIESPWYQARWGGVFSLTSDQNEKRRYENDKTGYRVAFGVTGGVMGEGGDCVAGDTLVATERGPISIADLHAMRGEWPMVWSMAPTGRMELRRIMASRKIEGRKTVKLRTFASDVLQCTDEHRIRTIGGYRPAKDFSGRGLPVVRLANVEMARRGGEVCEVFDGDTGLCGVPSAISAAGVRGGEADAAESFGSPGVFAGLQRGDEPRQGGTGRLRELRCGVSGAWAWERDVFSGVLVGALPDNAGVQAVAGSSVPAMRDGDGGQQQAAPILLDEVQERGTLGADGTSGKLQLQGDSGETWGVRSDQAAHHGTGLDGVSVRINKAVERSPYRQERDEQRPGEPTDHMLGVSQQSPQVEASTATIDGGSNGDDCGGTVDVYDLQIEGNHNFFANGILVHNCVVLDDPHDLASANSDVERERDIETFDAAIATRLNNPQTSAIVIVMQRLHEGDMCGHVLAAGGYDHLMIPMEYDSSRRSVTQLGWVDPRTEDGALMWPERFPRETVDAIKRTIGSMATAGQLQQSPAPAGGGLFKRDWLRYYEDGGDHYPVTARDGQQRRVLKSDCLRFGTCDLAIKTASHNDYSVIQVWDVEQSAGGLCFLVDQWRERREAPFVEDQLKATIARWSLVFMLIEDNSNFDTSVIQRFYRDGLPVKSIKPDKDKVTRAITASIWMEAGRVFFPLGAPWLSALEAELMIFPNGQHDDQVDSLSYAMMTANGYDYSPSAPTLIDNAGDW